jgi:hypothetical protein
VNDVGQDVGTTSVYTLRIGILNARSDAWEVLGAIDFGLSAALQGGEDIEEVDLFGLDPILSITRNVEPHFYVPLVEKLLYLGAAPRKVDNNRRGILHHIVFQLSARSKADMDSAIRRNISTLIAQLITVYGCNPILSDDIDGLIFCCMEYLVRWIVISWR